MRAARLALLLVFAATMANAAEVDPVIRAVYAAYEAGDAAAVERVWVPGPEATAFRRQMETTLRAKCVAVDALTIEHTGDDARVTARVRKWPRIGDGRATVEEQRVRVRLRQVDGAWRIASWTPLETELAGDLLAAPDDAARERLLTDSPELLTPTLMRALYQSALRMVNSGNLEAALRSMLVLRRAASINADAGGLSLATGIESMILRRSDEHDVAGGLRTSQEALRYAEESGDTDLVARALLNIARSYQLYDGNAVRAKPYCDRVLALGPSLEEQVTAVRCASLIAGFHQERRDYRSALEYVERVRTMAEPIGDQAGLQGNEITLGRVYFAQGDFELARRHFENVIEMSKATKVTVAIPEAVAMIARTYLSVGDDEGFIRTWREGAPADAGSLSPLGVEANSDFGFFYLSRGRFDKAEASFRETIRLAGENPVFWEHRATSLVGMAKLRMAQGRYAEALEHAQEATMVSASRDRPDVYGSLVLVARAHRALGAREAAYGALRDSIALTEATRKSVAGDEWQQQRFFGSRIDAYLELVDMLVEDGRVEEALHHAEQARARALLDALQAGRQHEQLTPDEQRQESELEGRLAALNVRILRGGEKAAAELRERRDQLRAELQTFRGRIESRYPRLRAEDAARTVPSLDVIGATMGRADTALVEYVVGPRHTHLFVVTWSADRKPRVTVHTIDIAEEALTKRVAAFAEQLATRDLLYRDEARALHRLLVGPAAKELSSKRYVCVIPDGMLWRLPFEALVASDGRFAAEAKVWWYAPSMSVAHLMTERAGRAAPAAANRLFLGFGDPKLTAQASSRERALYRAGSFGELPDARKEVEELARFYGTRRSRVYVEGEALENRAKQEAGSYRLLHFATHAVLDDRNPLYSHLLLARSGADPAEDGVFEAWEMMQLDLDADLTVLSACQTARGGVNPGEGLIGMTWALFVAGCPSTVASQWNVASDSTTQLMLDLHRAWAARRASPFPKAEAMNAAQQSLMRDSRYRHPFYWAAFALYGAGR